MTACDQARELPCIIDQQLISTMFHPIVDRQKRTVLGYDLLTGAAVTKSVCESSIDYVQET
jgi:hypothetical protein